MFLTTVKKNNLVKKKDSVIKDTVDKDSKARKIFSLTGGALKSLSDVSPENRSDFVSKAIQSYSKPRDDLKDDSKGTIESIDGAIEKIKISDRPSINEFAKDQERCLEELLAHIEQPFKDDIDFYRWQRKAKILQLNQPYKYDTFFMHNKALWILLVESKEENKAKRRWAIMLIHNHLVHSFALARQELFARETGPI